MLYIYAQHLPGAGRGNVRLWRSCCMLTACWLDTSSILSTVGLQTQAALLRRSLALDRRPMCHLCVTSVDFWTSDFGEQAEICRCKSSYTEQMCPYQRCSTLGPSANYMTRHRESGIMVFGVSPTGQRSLVVEAAGLTLGLVVLVDVLNSGEVGARDLLVLPLASIRLGKDHGWDVLG